MGIASRSDNEYATSTSLLYMAQGSLLSARFADSLKHAVEAQRIFKKHGDKVQAARATVIEAQVHSFDELMDDFALDAAQRALDLAREAKDAEAEDGAIRVFEEVYRRQNEAAARVAKPQLADMLVDASAEGEEDAGAAESVAVAAPTLEPDVVRPKVFEVVKNVTGADDEVHMDTPLMVTGINLPASLMFDYPNINQITDHIVESSK